MNLPKQDFESLMKKYLHSNVLEALLVDLGFWLNFDNQNFANTVWFQTGLIQILSGDGGVGGLSYGYLPHIFASLRDDIINMIRWLTLYDLHKFPFSFHQDCPTAENYYYLFDADSIDLLKEASCNGTSCNITQTVNSITTETNCISVSDCTGFMCCVDASRMSRSFVFGLYIDACNFTLRLTIDELEHTVNLADFNFGKIRWSY